MSKNHVLDQLGFVRVFYLCQFNHCAITVTSKVTVLVKHVSNATRHPGSEVSSGLAQNHDAAAGHVFAAMIADREHHGVDTAVADTEAFTCDPADVRFAAGRPIKADVADDHVVFRFEGRGRRWMNDDLAARQTLPDLIIGVAGEREGQATRYEGTETLSGRAREGEPNRIVR